MTSRSNDPCPHKIDFSRRYGRRSVPAGRGFMYLLFSAYPERDMLDGAPACSDPTRGDGFL
jgi:hypothetical protein